MTRCTSMYQNINDRGEPIGRPKRCTIDHEWGRTIRDDMHMNGSSRWPDSAQMVHPLTPVLADGVREYAIRDSNGNILTIDPRFNTNLAACILFIQDSNASFHAKGMHLRYSLVYRPVVDWREVR